MKADLHIHSYYSDGLMSPAEIAERCAQSDIKLAAITDHDNACACAEFAKECAARGVTGICGIEISAYTDVKVHILGYGIDCSLESFAEFEKLAREGALARTEEILSKLAKHGIKLGFDEVLRERRCDNSPIHSMYIARAAARKGYSRSPSAFYSDYLAPGKAAYSSLGRPSPEYALQVIRDCGGFSSLAHPGRITLERTAKLRLIERLRAEGLGGIEAVYSGHTDMETAYFKELAAKLGLIVTGGSDTHYAEGNRQIGEPVFIPSQELLSALALI